MRFMAYLGRRVIVICQKGLSNRVVNSVKLAEGDVADLTSLLFALDRVQPDVIFYLASQSYVPRNF